MQVDLSLKVLALKYLSFYMKLNNFMYKEYVDRFANNFSLMPY